MFKKGLVVIAAPFLFQVVFIAALLRSQADSSLAQGWAIHTKNVIAQAETTARYLTESQSAVRGLVVTGDPALGKLYEGAASHVSVELLKLRELVADNPGQQARVDAIKGPIDRFMAALAEKHRLALSGQVEEAKEMTRASAKEGTAAAIRRELDVFLGEEERLDRIRHARLEEAWRRQYAAIAAGAVASAVVGVLAVFAFSRGFSQRIGVMSGNARRLAAGEPLAAPLGGSDEIGKLDAVFHAMARSIAEKDQENEMFIYSVSHDLRSPLVNLQGFSKELALTCDDLRGALAGESAGVPERTKQRVDTLLDRDMKTSIHFIQTAVTRLSSIIDSLLRLSRAGRVELRPQLVDIRAMVGRVVEALGSTTTAQGARIVTGDLPTAWCDPTAVEQVFANLICNAVHYLDPARPGRIEVGSLEPESGDGLLTYFVKDNGLGIPKSYQNKLFLAFQRLHPEAAPGEGIGLALVRRMVDRLGGRVWLESEEGVGSTFYFTLPGASGEWSGEKAVASPAFALSGNGSGAASRRVQE